MPKSYLVSLVAVSLFAVPLARGQTLTWDNTPDTVGSASITNGSGNWNLTTSNWYHSGTDTNGLWPNDLDTIAQFGGGAPANPTTITVNGTINAGGLNFLQLNGTLVAGNAYTFTGGTLALKDNALIQFADGSTTGSIFTTINSNLNARDLTIQKSGGTVTQFANIGGIGSNLTGTVTIKGNDGGLFIRLGNLTNLTRVVVESGGTYNASQAAGTYSVPFSLAGFGGGTSDYGAIRIDTSNITLSGPITLTQSAGIRTNIDTMNSVLSGVISEATPGLGFTRMATSGLSTMIFSGASTFTGATNLGRVGSSTQGGINILDFAAAGSPVDNLFYHTSVFNPGALNMVGGAASTTALILRGAPTATNTQTFGNLTVSGTRASITLTSGTSGGSMALSIGTITRTSTATQAALLAFTLPANGIILTAAPEGFLGPWATQSNASGSASWATVTLGAIAPFTGNLAYPSGSEFSTLSGTPATAHVRVDGTSAGAVTSGTTAVSQVGTLTFADTANARSVNVGTGNTLKFAASGGVQMLTGSAPVTLGPSGTAGTITSGTTATNTAGQLFLTNFSSNLLTVNSVLANNGSTGTNSLVINGSGRVVLTGANTYTGHTLVASGALEISSNTALGTTAAATLVLQGASLRLNGNLTVAEGLTISGSGVANEGSLRSVAGSSTITGLVSIGQPSRISAAAGTILNLSPSGTDSISGSHALTLAGEGEVIVSKRMTLSSSALFKDGPGFATLRGTNVFTGATSILGGTLNLDFPGAAVATNILYNGTSGALTLGGGRLRLTGTAGATNTQSFTTLTNSLGASRIEVVQNGATSAGISFTTIGRTTGGLLDLTLPTTGAISTSASGVANSIITVNAVAYATIGGADWAAADSSTPKRFVGLSSISGGYTSSTATTLAGNANIALGVTTTTLSANATPTSLRFNAPQETLITQSATSTLTTGGILITPAVGANLSTIAVSTLRTAATIAGLDLVILQNNPTGDLLISSAIVGSGTGGVANALTKSGPGKVILTGTNTYSGATRVFDGTLQIAAGSLAATTDVSLGSDAWSGKFVLGRDLAVNAAINSLQVYGWGTDNAVVGGASEISTLTLSGTGTSNFSTGVLGGPLTNENNLGLTVTAGLVQLGGNNTYAGPTIVTGGTLSLVGSLSGTVGVSLNGGTLLLASSNVLNESATMTLAGGTFSTGGFSEGDATTVGLGTLGLSATSTLDFGSGTGSTLFYAGIGAHTAGAILQITNWSGNPNIAGSGSEDRLLFAGLSSVFTNTYAPADVTFNGVPGYTAIQIDETYFEIVAVPEPSSTVLLGASGLLAFVIFRERARFRRSGRRLKS